MVSCTWKQLIKEGRKEVSKGGGLLSMMGYKGRLYPKAIPNFQAVCISDGKNFTISSIQKGKDTDI